MIKNIKSKIYKKKNKNNNKTNLRKYSNNIKLRKSKKNIKQVKNHNGTKTLYGAGRFKELLRGVTNRFKKKSPVVNISIQAPIPASAQQLQQTSTRLQKTLPLPTRETRNNNKNTIREIKHFWYKIWPDKDVPPDKDKQKFINFIDILYDDIITDGGGTVIHCSAGIGRTGTIFVILKICLDKQQKLSELISQNKIITVDDVNNAIKYARMRRNNLMVQTFVQYNFILSLFNIKNNDINQQNLVTIINTNYKDEEYNKCTLNFNRYANTKPFTKTRVILPPLSLNPLKPLCDDYVNANYLNIELTKKYTDTNNNLYEGIKTLKSIVTQNTYPVQFENPESNIFKGVVIGAEGPTKTTVQRFLRMLGNPVLNIKRIIMVTNLVEEIDNNKCFDYTDGPNNLTILKNNTEYGNLSTFTLLQNSNTNDYSLVYTNEILVNSITNRNPNLIDDNKIAIERLNTFFKDIESLSLCDYKIILLYILLNNLSSIYNTKILDKLKLSRLKDLTEDRTQSQHSVGKFLITILQNLNLTYTLKQAYSCRTHEKPNFTSYIVENTEKRPTLSKYSQLFNIEKEDFKTFMNSIFNKSDILIKSDITIEGLQNICSNIKKDLEPSNIFDPFDPFASQVPPRVPPIVPRKSGYTRQLFSNPNLERLNTFILRKIQNLNTDPFTYCDLKIILLYILLHDLLPEHNQNISELITTMNNKTMNNKTTFIKSTLSYLTPLIGLQLDTIKLITKKVNNECKKLEVNSLYAKLYAELYAELFNIEYYKFNSGIQQIFDYTGNYNITKFPNILNTFNPFESVQQPKINPAIYKLFYETEDDLNI